MQMFELYSCIKRSLSLSTVGDGRFGYSDGAPYDAIHVGAAAATVPKAVRTCMTFSGIGNGEDNINQRRNDMQVSIKA